MTFMNFRSALLVSFLALASAGSRIAEAGEHDPPGEIGDTVYYDCDYGLKDATGTWWKDWLAVLLYNWVQYPGHAGLYIGATFDNSQKALIHCDNPDYYYDTDRLRYPLPEFAFYETRALYAEQLDAFTTPPDGSDYRGSKTANPQPTPSQRTAIVSYALEKHDLPITYWSFEETTDFTAKGSYWSPSSWQLSENDYASEQSYIDDNLWLSDAFNAWSCVGFVERCYESAGLDPTPNEDEILTPIIGGGRSVFVVPNQYNSANMQWASAVPPKVLSKSYLTTRNTDIVVRFAPDNLNGSSFAGNVSVVGSSSGSQAASLTYEASTYKLTINPTTDFSYGETVTVTLTTGIKDLAGNALDGDGNGTAGPSHVFSFTVQSAPGPAPTAINLTCAVSPTAVSPGGATTASGTANYNNSGGAVPAGTVNISVGGKTYTASISGGSYSRVIAGPGSPGSYAVSADALDGVGRTGSASASLTVDSNGSTPDYDINGFLTCKSVDSGEPWNYHDEISAFGSDDARFYVWWELTDITDAHPVTVKLYRPDGTFYGERSWMVGKDGWTYDWWRANAYWQISGYDIADLEGKWRVKLYIDGSYKQSIYFTLRYNFVEHRMVRDHQSIDPYSPIGETYVFKQTDARAETWCHLEMVSNPLEMKWVFYEPSGSQYFETNYISDNPNSSGRDYWGWYHFWGRMGVQGRSAENKCGDWYVDVYIKDCWGTWDKEYTEHFRIIEDPAQNPGCTVSTSPANPHETQGVTITATATDNTYLKSVSLYWNDGSLHSQTWDDLYSGSVTRNQSVGPFAAGAIVEYWAVATDTSGNVQESTREAIQVQAETVTSPNRPTGLAFRRAGESGTYTTGGSTTSLGNPVEYQFDWGDFTQSSWSNTSQMKSWGADGHYWVTARARSQPNPTRETVWGNSLMVTVDSQAPVVEIATHGGTDFITNATHLVVEGGSADAEPASGVASVAISSGQTNEGTLARWRFNVSLSEGTNVFTITATDNAGNVGMSQITIAAAPTVPSTMLMVAPTNLQAHCIQGTDATGQTFKVWNAGNGTVSYEVLDNAEWLAVAQTNGSSAGMANAHTVNYDTAGLAPGTYFATITVTGAPTSIPPTRAVAVTLTVFPDLGYTVYYVWSNSPNPSIPYATWESASRTIQEAVNAASGGDMVVVGPGLYSENIHVLGKQLTLRSSDGPDLTTIDGHRAGSVVTISQSASGTVSVAGFTITGGLAAQGGGIYCNGGPLGVSNCHILGNATLDGAENTGEPGGDGGGIFASSNCALTVTGCVISNNVTGDGAWPDYPTQWRGGSGGGGGGIWCHSGEIRDTLILANRTGGGVYGGVGGDGGGIRCQYGIISNCTVAGNLAGEGIANRASRGGNGGGIWLESGAVIASILNSNRTGTGADALDDWTPAGGDGGGLYCHGSVSIERCAIECNSTGPGGQPACCLGGSGGNGGGVYASEGCSLAVTGCRIVSNGTGSASAGESHAGNGGNGAGIYCNEGTVAGSRVECNVAGHGATPWYGTGSAGGKGAGICAVQARVSACVVAQNQAGNGGDGGVIIWTDPEFTGETGGAGGTGGGICAARATITGCSIWGNRAGSGGRGGSIDVGINGDGGNGGNGGGVYCSDGTFLNCTVRGNAAGACGEAGGGDGDAGLRGAFGIGGGLFVLSGGVTNCILWDDTPDEIGGTTARASHCAVMAGTGQTWFDPATCIDADPQFVNPNVSNSCLLITSPCVNAGTNEAWMTGAADLDGNPRIIGGIVDMGAYESPALILAVFSANGTPEPPRGTNLYVYGTNLACLMPDSPDAAGSGTQFVCTAVSVGGNSYTQTSATNVLLTLTNNTVLTWLWETQYWLQASAEAGGTVVGARGDWCDACSVTSALAVASNYYHFVKWTGTVETTANPLALWMYGPHAITAIFGADLATNETPVWWLAGHHLTNGSWNAVAVDDSDADGLLNWQEWIAGTDPTNPRSVLSVTNLFPDGTGYVLHWPSISNRIYTVDRATNLILPGFEVIATNLPATPPVNVHTDQVPGWEKVFYRIKVGQP